MICPECGENGVGSIPKRMQEDAEYGCYLCGWTGIKHDLQDSFECGRCGEPLKEEHTIFKPERNRQGRTPLHPGCYVASRLLMQTRGPIYNNPEDAIQPARVYARVLSYIQHGQTNELLSDSLKQWLPKYLEDQLSDLRKALDGEGPVGAGVEEQEEQCTQDSLDAFDSGGDTSE